MFTDGLADKGLTCIRQLLLNSAAAAFLGAFRDQYGRKRAGSKWGAPGHIGRSPGCAATPPHPGRPRNCQPHLPTGETDPRFPAVYYGLFPFSEGVGGTAYRNPGLVSDVGVNHRGIPVAQEFLDRPDV